MNERSRIICGDCLDILKKTDSDTIDCCVTSPPYFNLRDYGITGQVGLERTPGEYIYHLVTIFHEVKRVLKPDGTLWVVIGDSYAGSGKGAGNYPESSNGALQKTNRGSMAALSEYHSNTVKPRDLIGIPWELAFALREDGWYLRQDIIWSKPNPMPESVKNRCTSAHEHIFLLSKSSNYYFDAEAIAEPVSFRTTQRLSQDIGLQAGSVIRGGGYKSPMTPKSPRYKGKKYTDEPDKFYRTKSGEIYDYRAKRNKRDVWTITTKAFKGAHFATFPPDLIEPCILAGSRPGGTVLDPFFGSGTTGLVAEAYGREYLGIEINPDYIEIARKRLNQKGINNGNGNDNEELPS